MRAPLSIPVGERTFETVGQPLEAGTNRDQAGLTVPALTNDEVVHVIGTAQRFGDADQRVDEIRPDPGLIRQRRVDLKVQAPCPISGDGAGFTPRRTPAGRPRELPADMGIPAAP